MAECKTCANYTDFNEVDNGCYMCCKGLENNYKPKQTNADRIRSMTDEELAKTLTDDIPCKMCGYWSKEISSCNAPFSFLCTKGYAEALILQWLQSEAE